MARTLEDGAGARPKARAGVPAGWERMRAVLPPLAEALMRELRDGR